MKTEQNQRVYFEWRNCYWSGTQQQYDYLVYLIRHHRPYDLNEFRLLSSKPAGPIIKLKC